MFVPCHLSSRVWSQPEFNSCEATGTNQYPEGKITWDNSNSSPYPSSTTSPLLRNTLSLGLSIFQAGSGWFCQGKQMRTVATWPEGTNRSRAPQKGKVLSFTFPKGKSTSAWKGSTNWEFLVCTRMYKNVQPWQAGEAHEDPELMRVAVPNM